MRLRGKLVVTLAILALIVVAIPIVLADLNSPADYNHSMPFPVSTPGPAPANGQGPGYSGGNMTTTSMGNSTGSLGPKLYVVTNGWGVGEYNPNTFVGSSYGVENHMLNDKSIYEMALDAPDATLYTTGAQGDINQIDTLTYNVYNGNANSYPYETVYNSSIPGGYWADNNVPTLVSPDGNYIYFQNGTVLYKLNWGEGTVTSINLNSGANAMALTPDGSKLYANLLEPSYIEVINTSTMTEVKDISYPYSVHINSLAINSAGTLLYAGAGYWYNMPALPSVRVIDTTTDSVIDTIYLGSPTGQVNDLVVDPNPANNRLYVAWAGTSGQPGNITCIDTTDDAIVRNIQVQAGSNPPASNIQHIVALNGTRYLFVSADNYHLYRLDLSAYPVAIVEAVPYGNPITDLAVG